MSAARVAQDVNTHFIHFLLDRKNILLISPGSISQWQGSEQISTPNSRQISSRSWWGCRMRSRVRKWTKLENFLPSTVALTANGSLKSLWRYTKWAFICLLNTSCKCFKLKLKFRWRRSALRICRSLWTRLPPRSAVWLQRCWLAGTSFSHWQDRYYCHLMYQFLGKY